ncbi:MAG: hypothetical protein EWV51_14430 [Microcystis panniformis Mp_MB_F_20051200_S6]|nr:MAG: hypothetical protein EWV51_14430 [Microcystis panniformis Mp_MB_F_20051200_S6]
MDFFRFSPPLYRLVISYQLSVISYPLSVISYPLSDVSFQLCGNEVYTDSFFDKIVLKVLPDKHFTIP